MEKATSIERGRSAALAEIDLSGLILTAAPPVMVAIRDTVRGFASPERTLLQFRVFTALLRGPSTTTELAQLTGASAAAISKVAAAMAALGLIERCPDADDRRVTHLALSAEGEARALAMLAAVRGDLSARLSKLPAADRRRLAEGLSVLARLFARPTTTAPAQETRS
jgi:DNA-binding MarR family transcriptional regulator